MVTTRYYTISDYADVKTILQECDLFDDVWETQQNLERKISRDPQSILLAQDNDRIIGCVFIVEDGWNGFIWRLAVKKEYQQRGVGSLLLEKAQEIIKKRGIKESSLFVRTDNDELQNWYTKRGYQGTSNYLFMYKEL